jgi:hypothetical protein
MFYVRALLLTYNKENTLMTNQTVTPPTGEEHAKRFRETHQGKGLTDKQIEDICSAILSSQKPRVGEEGAYYKANLVSVIFYINVMINVRSSSTPDRFFKHFIGHCGGLAVPGDSFFDPVALYTCDPYTVEDIFNKQVAIEIDSHSIQCFIRFFDKDNHLLGWMWGAGAGSVIGVMGGKGEWKNGYLS